MKKFLMFILLSTSCFAGEIYTSKDFQPLVNKIQAIPAGSELIQKATQDGDIRVMETRNQPKKFLGYWSPGNRIIYLTDPNKHTDSELLTTLVFELHNASRDRDFSILDRTPSTKADYVRQTELIEYQNVKATEEVLQQGRQLGLIPKDCRFNHYLSFEEHLKLQKRTGHSKYIADNYDRLKYARTT